MEKLPGQAVLEMKYLSGQEVYRFELDGTGSTGNHVLLLNMKNLTLLNLGTNHTAPVRRRPLLVTNQLIQDKNL